MFDKGILLRFTRINNYLHILMLIFPLIFLISPTNLFSYKTIAIFLANLFLTAFGYMFNDIEDAEDDYHDVEKRKRNPIASGEITKRQSYLFSFFLLSIGLFLLIFINPSVFFLGLIFAFVGISYSWKPLKLKSIPIIDLISHVISLGVLQFFITYLAFRRLDLFVTPFLMIIIPFSMMNEIIHELEDFDVDKKTKINNTVQKFEKHDIKKLLITSVIIIIMGSSIIIFTIPMKYKIINLLISIFASIALISKVKMRASSIM